MFSQMFVCTQGGLGLSPGRSLSGGSLSGSLCPGGLCLGGLCPGGLCPGGFCPWGLCLVGLCYLSRWFLKPLESVSVSVSVSVSRWLQKVFRNHSPLENCYRRPSVTIDPLTTGSIGQWVNGYRRSSVTIS